MPSLLSDIRHAHRRQIHPESDDDAEQRRDDADARGPDDDAAPLRLMLPQRREVKPVRDGAEVRTDARTRRRVLHDLARVLRHVDLLAVGPRVLPQWTRTRSP